MAICPGRAAVPPRNDSTQHFAPSRVGTAPLLHATHTPAGGPLSYDLRAGGYLAISDGVRLTSSRGMTRMPNAAGRFSCPHSGSISNGDLHPSSLRG